MASLSVHLKLLSNKFYFFFIKYKNEQKERKF